jgi:hypothetical protein
MINHREHRAHRENRDATKAIKPAKHRAYHARWVCIVEDSNRNMKPSQALSKHRDAVLQIAREVGAENVRIFGSVLYGEDDEGSDLDLLVDVPRGTTLLDMARRTRASVPRRTALPCQPEPLETPVQNLRCVAGNGEVYGYPVGLTLAGLYRGSPLPCYGR